MVRARVVAVGGGTRDWPVEVGADAAVRELGFRQFGASGEFGLVLDGEPFGPEVPVAMCGIVDGVEVAPAVPVDGYRSGFGGGLTASSLYVWQDDAADAWWEPTAAPLGGDFAAAASDSMSDSDADWWTPAPTSRNKRSEPLLGSLAGAPAGGWELVVVAGLGARRRLVAGGKMVSLLVDYPMGSPITGWEGNLHGRADSAD